MESDERKRDKENPRLDQATSVGRAVMKIYRVTHNNRKRAFEVKTRSRTFSYPYAKLEVQPRPRDKIAEVYVDRELGGEAFTYVLESGREGTVHVDQVLEYNQDPRYLSDLLLYKLTVEAQ